MNDDARITQEAIRKVVSYDPDTGVFRRLVSTSSRARCGEIAGSLRQSGSGKAYLCFMALGKSLSSHRWAFLYMTGKMPIQVDHLNGNGCDNRWSNLRAATNVENCRNQRLRSSNTSGCLGVTWHKKSNQWAIRINDQGRRVYLGYRKTLAEAIEVRKQAEQKYGYAESHGTDRPLFSRIETTGKWAIYNLQEAA